MVQQRKVKTMGVSFSSVYKDRLLVESYIYELSELMGDKQLLFVADHLETESSIKVLAIKNHQIASMFQDFIKTKLIPEEVNQLQLLQSYIDAIVKLEHEVLSQESKHDSEQLEENYRKAASTLHQLSNIQL